jgi:hypothetical protein
MGAMSHPTINQQTAARLLQEAFDSVVTTQQENIGRAAGLVAALPMFSC